MITHVKKQHYVWEHYLSAWLVNGKIWCSRNGNTFNTSTENVAQERYFYEAMPLNDIETNFVRELILRCDVTAHQTLLDNFNVYLQTANGDDFLRKNGLEHYHNLIEGPAATVLNELNKGNFGILDDKQMKINFSRFIGRQYTRTKKIKNSYFDIPENTPIELKEHCDFKKISDVMNFILADNIGNWIFSAGKFNILINKSEISLITGDQPVYNILAKKDEPPTSFELYFPISPNLAFYISEDIKETQYLTNDKVKQYNEYIKSISFESIFGNSEEILI